MANGQLLHMVNGIAEELSADERRRLCYLCGVLDADSCVAGVREMLKFRLSQGQADHLFLVELLFRLKRFDVLKKVFRINKQDIASILGPRQAVSEYRVLMADVSEDMGTDDLQSLKFLLSSTLPRERMDRAKNFLDVVVELEKLDRVSPQRLDLIEQYLMNIGRADLARKVRLYQTSGGMPQRRLCVPNHVVKQSTFNTAYNPMLLAASGPHHPSQGHSRFLTPENRRLAGSETRGQCHQSPMDVYKLQGESHGVCMIIDCVGSDGGMLEEMFLSLHFKVVLHKWLSVNDTLSCLRGVSRSKEYQEADAFACCIISRGTTTDLLATDSHSTGLRLDTVRHLFTSEACPSLAGKPKLFFIQSYSVPETQSRPRAALRDEDLETDGPTDGCHGVETVPSDADIFWSHCWTEERQLEGHHHQSVYLQALREALLKGQRRKTNLLDVHTEMNGVIYDHNKRNPGESYNINLRHTLRKNLYLL